jgi:hypothetical protein
MVASRDRDDVFGERRSRAAWRAFGLAGKVRTPPGSGRLSHQLTGRTSRVHSGTTPVRPSRWRRGGRRTGDKPRLSIMNQSRLDRRAFFAGALTMVAIAPTALSAEQNPEAGVSRFELPAKSTVWGVIAFLGEDMIEVTVATARKSKSEHGRFDGKRLVEFSWVNGGADVERITLSAKSLSTGHELPWAAADFAAHQHLFVGFGRRSMPIEVSDRLGGYPHDAVFAGFIVFD